MAGLTTEIKYKGIPFFIQTQDLGFQNQRIESLIYKSGTLLTSRKTNYTHLLNSPDLKHQIDRLMKEQHAAVVRDIQSGKLDPQIFTDMDPGEHRGEDERFGKD